ncbi:MAG: NERD domain-containing protein [Anaerolineales bacterium]|nr:NERD domain-containing protein [Anaerolineales bacterium]
MRIVTATKTVQRNTTLARYATTAGIVLLVGALFINLYALSRPEETQLLVYVIATFFVGYTLSNVGGLLNRRWGRRSDRGLADALRGLDDRHTLYNYRLGADHVLVAPSGVYVLHPKYQGGPIQFADKKWKAPQERRSFLNVFAPHDALGNPALEATSEAEALKGFLKKHAPEATVEPRPLVVFMNSRAVLEVTDAPVTTLHVKQLKDYIRRQTKAESLAAPLLTSLETKLGFTAAQES